MDEILASIRRIIESGDERDETSGDALLSISPGAPSNDAPQAEGSSSPILASPVPPFDIHYLSSALGDERTDAREAPAAASGDVGATVEIDATEPSRADDTAFHDQQVVRPSVAPSSDVEVSDDAWWDAAVADANDVEADVEPLHEDAVTARAEPPFPVNENLAARDGAETLRSNWSAVAQDTSPAPGEPVEPSSAGHEAPFVPALSSAQAVPSDVQPRAAVTVEPAGAAPMEARAEMPESVIAGASALLSMQAGDQVAAAFDDLTRAIREGHMRSMEGMAREIMRPMLQEWLDDNLPRIVERLVRDEIERIARGPRR